MCIVLGIVAIWQLASVRTTPTIWTDQHCYMSLAESLIAGHGYTLGLEPHTKYPPGLPFILAIFGKLLGDSYHVYT